MVNELIKEINIALKNDCWFVALNTALTLPDICSKAEYPDYQRKSKKDDNRYVKWLKKFTIGIEDLIKPREIYALRCCMLHQGTPSTKQDGGNIEEFELIINSIKQSSITEQAIYNTPNKRVLSVNVLYVCQLLCASAKMYYDKNKEKFNFFKYRAVSVHYRTATIFTKKEDAFKIDFE